MTFGIGQDTEEKNTNNTAVVTSANISQRCLKELEDEINITIALVLVVPPKTKLCILLKGATTEIALRQITPKPHRTPRIASSIREYFVPLYSKNQSDGPSPRFKRGRYDG